jgi:HSP20 family molecular chaperone IbpA
MRSRDIGTGPDGRLKAARALGQMFEAAPTLRYESPFGMPSPASDITEDDTGYKQAAELPGMSEKEIEVVVSGDTLTLKGEKKQEKRSLQTFPKAC